MTMYRRFGNGKTVPYFSKSAFRFIVEAVDMQTAHQKLTVMAV